MRAPAGSIEQLKAEVCQLYAAPSADYRGQAIRGDVVLRALDANHHRIRETVQRLAALGPGKKVLDIGIAYGFPDVILKEAHGLDITGLELPANIPSYCLLPQAHGIPIVPGALGREPLPFAEASYDAVILAEVIEHLRLPPLQALREIARVLAPGGLLLLTTPNIARLANVARLLANRNILEPLPDDDAGLAHITEALSHLHEYTMPELAGLARRAGYDVSEARHSLAYDLPRPGQRGPARWRRLAALPILALIPRLRSLLWLCAHKI